MPDNSSHYGVGKRSILSMSAWLPVCKTTERAVGWNSGMGNRYLMEQQEGGIKGLPGYFARSSRGRLTHDTAET